MTYETRGRYLEILNEVSRTSSLMSDGVAIDEGEASEEAIEDEQLAAPSEFNAVGRRGLEPLFEGLLEGQRRSVLASGHRAAPVLPRPPRWPRSRDSSFAETIPRRRAWRIPCRTRSATTFAWMPWAGETPKSPSPSGRFRSFELRRP